MTLRTQLYEYCRRNQQEIVDCLLCIKKREKGIHKASIFIFMALSLTQCGPLHYVEQMRVTSLCHKATSRASSRIKYRMTYLTGRAK